MVLRRKNSVSLTHQPAFLRFIDNERKEGKEWGNEANFLWDTSTRYSHSIYGKCIYNKYISSLSHNNVQPATK